MRTSTLFTDLLVAVLGAFGIQTAAPPPFHGVGILAPFNHSVQTSSDDFLANLPTMTPTPVTAAPPPTMVSLGLPWTLSTLAFPSSATTPVLAPATETVTISVTGANATRTLRSNDATTGVLSTSLASVSSVVPVTMITVSPLPASSSTEPVSDSFTSASETSSGPEMSTSSVLGPLTAAPPNSTASVTDQRKLLSRGQRVAAIAVPIMGLLLIAIAVAVGYWLRIRRQERQRADRLEQRARWFRQDHNDWIRTQMSTFDESKVGRNPFTTPTPSSDTICRPRTRPRQFSGSTIVVNRPEEAAVDRVVRRRGGVENLRS
ncbi:uncharacterized protein Z519_06399 [Cladophialophora bantiana CBS 173.52]|uniref:Mid2 domain-containing protein n=1 Tax=Cladophialophora bantiana (strain ATCC 10958 / CBS 173.52 / CDC B-1940 / NIH 8579) TaxID=1442370 RepID=A0A0D2G1F9_CLAB1|nr:uncharacterized protein Z519_06399 [Cladophialophora bantiana CBS 173.52]KIW92552.1 hypothetical protein Z519_06399 [Cladophialophora bantiana CBS 173.52]